MNEGVSTVKCDGFLLDYVRPRPEFVLSGSCKIFFVTIGISFAISFVTIGTIYASDAYVALNCSRDECFSTLRLRNYKW